MSDFHSNSSLHNKQNLTISWQSDSNQNYIKKNDNYSFAKAISSIVMLLPLTAFGSSSTTVDDSWLHKGRMEDSTSTARNIAKRVGRRVSRKEALKIARQTLERAEQERLDIAEAESLIGIQWEDDE